MKSKMKFVVSDKLLRAFCFLFLSLLSAQNFQAIINAAGGTAGINYDLTFGFAPDATNGFDEEFDEYAPPAPPPPLFDAALSVGGDRFYKLILAGDGDLSEHIYDIALQYDTDNLITLTWNNTGWDVIMTSALLQDAFGGVWINIDMLTTTSATLNNPAFNTLKLKITPADAGVLVPPTASFSVDPLSGGAGLTVFTFTDESTGEAEIISWNWNFGDGATSIEQNPTHLYASAGVYSVSQSVVDANASFSEEVTMVDLITVNSSPPIADLGPDTTIYEFSEIVLGANSYDPDGVIQFYLYSNLETGLQLATDSTYTFVAPEYDSDEDMTITIELSILDNDNLIGQDTVVVTVQNLLIPPVANAGEDNYAFENYEYLLDGSGSFDDMEEHGHEITYSWSADASILFNDSMLERPVITFPEVENDSAVFIIVLNVTDNDGLSDNDSIAIELRAVPPFYPQPNAGPNQIVSEGDTITMDGSLSTDQRSRDIISYLWTSTDTAIVFENDTTVITTFIAPEVMSDTVYPITLTVWDDSSNVMSDITIVTVIYNPNNPPVANAGIGQSVIENIVVTLDGSGSHDPTSTGIINYHWTSVTESIILLDQAEMNPTFLSPQVNDTTDFQFSLIVNDGEFDSPADTVTVTVAEQNFNTDLVGQLTYEQGLNDIWGYSSGNGTEYALVGSLTGTSIVDVTTNPSEPNEVAFIPGLESGWRDIKTYQNYMYVGTEAYEGGIQVVNIEDPPTMDSTFIADSVHTWTGVSNSHNIFQADGYLYVVGASGYDIHILDLSNPAQPVEVGGWNGEYIHDIYVRGDYAYGAGIYSSTMYIIDISDKTNPQTVTSWSYSGKAHACWLTENGNYLITADEMSGGHVKIWDIRDFENINLVSEWTAADAENLTVHNVFVRDNFLYCSYYVFGLQIVDISDPSQPFLAGYFDSYLGDNELFGGNWGIYPFTESCNIYISDRSNGLFVVDFPECGAYLSSISDIPNPQSYQLHAAFPNPFNPITTIRFEIPSVETWHAVSLQIYDIAGRLVEPLVDEILEPGYHTTQWNAKNFASGVYFVRLETGNFHDTQKVILLK